MNMCCDLCGDDLLDALVDSEQGFTIIELPANPPLPSIWLCVNCTPAKPQTAPQGRTERDMERITIEFIWQRGPNMAERDVNESTDYLCDECSTETLEVWHEKRAGIEGDAS